MLHQKAYIVRSENTAHSSNIIEIVSDIVQDLGVQELYDFVSTVEGYTKYLETTVKLNKDADEAIKDIT